MKKRLIGSLLLGAFLVASTSMFVSCKDYDDDINRLQSQIDANKASLDKLQSLIQQGSILKSVTPVDGGVAIVITKNGTDQTFTITNGKDGKDGQDGQDGVDGTNGTNGTNGTPGTVWTIKENFWYVDKGDGNGAQKTDYRAVPTVEIKDGYWYINGEKTDVKAEGKDGKDGTDGQNGKDGEDGQNGKDGQNNQGEVAGVKITIGTNGNWFIDGKDTGMSSKGSQGEPGAPGDNGVNGKYYVPNGSGTFDIYQDGVKLETTNIKYWSEGTVTATKSDSELQLFGVNGDYTNAVTISLSGTLQALVFIPHLYLDGIEAIQYKWIGDTILKLYPKSYNFTDNDVPRSHHRANNDVVEAGSKWKKIGGELNDWLPNRLARRYAYDATNGPRTEIGEDDKSLEPESEYTAAREWIYGPVWPVEYHLNPATSKVVYDEAKAPAFNVLEPDVIYYNTRATQTVLNITSPKEYEYYNKHVDVYGIQNGILTVGLKIEHPQYLAPWPTDETINPNGNTTTTVSYPAYPGDDDYGHNIPGANSMGANNEGYPNHQSYSFPWADWYGYAKYIYNKDNKDNTIALQIHNEDGAENIITSDYALIVPTRATLEGLVWNKAPMYAEPNIPGRAYGPQNRIGDEEGWAVDEYTNCLTGENARVHIYDSPEEALADPDGASLELDIDPSGLDLKPYLAVHMLVENIKKKETAPGEFNQWAYDIIKVPYGEELKWGLHYEFELVQYIIDGNETSDSRYACFKDWSESESYTYSKTGKTYDIVKGWNANTDKSGIIIARNVTPDGKTTTDAGKTIVDREPLVRVMLKNAKDQVLLDGYILLHINYLPDNKEIVMPMEAKKFDLCNALSAGTTWSQSSRIVLTEGTEMSKMLFEDIYWADCIEMLPNKVGNTTSVADASNFNDTAYVTPYAYQVAMQDVPYNAHGIYQMKIFNFGDIYGNDPSAAGYAADGTAFAPATAPVNGANDEFLEESNEFENKAMGDVAYYPNGDGNTNFVWIWTLSPEEVEYLTHDKADNKPIYVTRWIRYVAKDVKRARSVYAYDRWPYVWVRLTIQITRDAKAYAYEEKNEDYWFHYQTGGDGAGTGSASDLGWSGVFVDIQAPEFLYHKTIRHQQWQKNLSDNLIKNKIKFDENDMSRWKYYFAPKPYEITALNGVTYIITPKSNKDDNDFDKLYCKYVYPHYFANFNWTDGEEPYTDYEYAGTKYSFYTDPGEAIKAQDAHTWDEATLKATLAQCAIDYNAGVFTNTILYANRKGTDEYTPIAMINYQEQIDGTEGTYATAGQIELIHWLKNPNLDSKDYAGRLHPIFGTPSTDPGDTENLVCYEVLNAIGYAMLPNDNEKLDTICAYDNNHSHIGYNDWNEANAKDGKNGYTNAGTDNQKIELYSWLGVVRNNGCDVAQFVEQKQRDDDKVIATFKASWERPINLKAPYLDPAKDAASNENIIYLIKYLKLFDWRGIEDPAEFARDHWGYMWKDHSWFWAYYNVWKIEVDLRKSRVMTNMHHKTRVAAGGNEWVPLNEVTNSYDDEHLMLRIIDEDGNRIANTRKEYTSFSDWSKTGYNDWTYGHALGDPDNNFAGGYQLEESANTYVMNMMGLKAETPNGTVLSEQQLEKNMRRFGAIYYKNNTGNVEDFDLRIPITIWYEWGYLDYTLNLHVARTSGSGTN